MMARRKRRGGRHKRPLLDKAFDVLGIFVAAGPAIQGVGDHLQSDPQNIPAGIAYRYTGMDVNSGNWDQAQALRGFGTVAAGGVVASIPRIFRLVRGFIKGR